MAKKLASLFLVLFVSATFASALFADDYYFLYSMATEGGQKYVILGGTLGVDEDTNDVGIRNQFQDWMEAYAEEVSGIEYFEFSSGIRGPYSSRSDAEQERRDCLGDYRNDDWKVYDITRLSVPSFRYYD